MEPLVTRILGALSSASQNEKLVTYFLVLKI
jgi:hypothetical protein